MVRMPRKGRCWDRLLGLTGADVGVSPEVRLRFTTEVTAESGDTFRVERSGSAVLLIGDGMLKSERGLPDGSVAVTGFHYPGDVVEVPFPIARETVFEAVTHCQLREIDLQEAIRLIPDREALLECVGDHAMTRIADDESRILGLAHRSAAERLVAFLESLAARPGTRNGNPDMIWTPMRRDDIANYLGMQPETLSRTYAELARTGVIAVPSRSQVKLLLRPRSQRHAGPSISGDR
jgi:CRP-like cAMP-binding protein